MQTKTLGVIATACLVLAALVFVTSSADAQTQPNPPPSVADNPVPLKGASSEQVRVYAIEWAKAALNEPNPVILRLRGVEIAELPALGMGQIGNDPTRGYTLVIYEGEFAHLEGAFPGWGNPEDLDYRYVVVVFDNPTGRVAMVSAFPVGTLPASLAAEIDAP